MQKRMLILCSLALGIRLMTGCAGTHDTPAPPQAKQGVLDLSGWDAEGSTVKLRGEWKFYWHKLLDPADREAPVISPAFIKVPGVWSDLVVDGKPLPKTGYGTYELEIILGNTRRPLGLKTYWIGTACTIWVDGKLLAANGVVGADERAMRGLLKPQMVFFTPERDRFRIVIQVSNFKDRFGGLWTDLFLGSDKQIATQNGFDIASDMTIFGVCFIVALFYFISFIVVRNDRSLLHFGICCLMFALRTLTAGELFISALFPRIDFEVTHKIMFLSQAVTAAFFTMFLKALFPKEVSTAAVRVVQGLMAVYGIVILAAPLLFYSELLSPFCVFLVVLGAYLAGAVVLAVIRTRPEARLALAAFGILLVTMVNDILYAHMLIPTGYVMMYGLIVFSLCFILILSLRTRRLHLDAARHFKERELDENARAVLFQAHGVSKREREVVPLVLQGLTYHTIADRLFISVSTLRKHIHSVYRKLDVKNRMELDYFLKTGGARGANEPPAGRLPGTVNRS
jgi:DNA-binding CsgD family transcriptional regulator